MSQPTDDPYLQAFMAAQLARDPMKGFLASLADPGVKFWAEGTVRLEQEFLEHTQRMFASTNGVEAVGHATWIARHAVEVAHRRVTLRQLLADWMAQHVDPIVVRIPEEG